MALQFTPNRQSTGNLQFSGNTAGRLSVFQSVEWDGIQNIPANISAIENLSGVADLVGLEGMSTTGLIARTGEGLFSGRTLTAPASGITVTNPAGLAGNPTLVLANDLAALEGLGSTGIAARTATDTWAQRTLTAPAAGLTISNPAGIAGNPTFALANDLAALEALSGTNTLYYRSATDTWTAVTVGANLTFSGGVLSHQSVVPPQGRLTLQSATPEQTADQTSKTTIFYAPYIGQHVPIYNGSDIVATSIISSSTDAVGLSLAMAGSANWPSGTVFDLFITLNAGVATLCSVAWSSTTVRGTGANSAEQELFGGLKTNKNSIAAARTSSGTIAIAAHQGLYVGTFYATANGTTSMTIHPTSASGGTNNFLGLYNSYNPRRIIAKSQDSTSSWSYASATTRLANNSASNRINFVDGEAIRQWEAWYGVSVASGNAAANASTVGVEIDNISNFSGGAGEGAHLGQAAFVSSTQFGCQLFGFYAPYPLSNAQGSFLGLHFAQAMEQSTAVAETFFGNDFMMLTLEIEM